jgi:selenocysteine-specific elongation factor
MPQTREHFQICRLLEVSAGVVVLTKCDLADADMREIAAMDVAELVKDSFLAAAPVVEVSAKTGEGLDRLRSTLEAEAGKVPARGVDGPVRLPIDRVFTVKGFGTVVTGTLVSGTLREEQELVVLPAAQPVKVRGLQLHGRRDVAAAAGRRTAVNLGGVEVADLARGDTLCEPGAFEATRRVDVTLDLLEDARPLKHGARIRFHQGTSELLGRVALASRRGAGNPIAEAAPGDTVYARIRLEAPAVLTRGDRFIVRAYSPSITIGGGRVLDPHPPREAIRTDAGRARLTSLNDSLDRAVIAYVAERRGAGLPRAALVSRAGLTGADARAVVERLAQAGEFVLAGDLLVSANVAKALADRLMSELQAHHKAHPLAEGMPREEARERVFGKAALPVFEHVVERLVAAGRITARDRLALAGHAVSLSPEESRVQERLLSIYRQAKLAPPDAAAAAADAAASKEIVERVLKLLLRQRSLVKVDTLVFHAEALEGLKADVRALKGGAADARVDVASFKEKYGITRKYAIPLLEFLDRERITRRVGDSRVVL